VPYSSCHARHATWLTVTVVFSVAFRLLNLLNFQTPCNNNFDNLEMQSMNDSAFLLSAPPDAKKENYSITYRGKKRHVVWLFHWLAPFRQIFGSWAPQSISFTSPNTNCKHTYHDNNKLTSGRVDFRMSQSYYYLSQPRYTAPPTAVKKVT
jgi:hypothetical protein